MNITRRQLAKVLGGGVAALFGVAFGGLPSGKAKADRILTSEVVAYVCDDPDVIFIIREGDSTWTALSGGFRRYNED